MLTNCIEALSIELAPHALVAQKLRSLVPNLHGPQRTYNPFDVCHQTNKKKIIPALQLQHVPEEEEETKPEESQGAKQTHRSSMHGHGKLATIDDDGIQRAARRRCWLVTWADFDGAVDEQCRTVRRPPGRPPPRSASRTPPLPSPPPRPA